MGRLARAAGDRRLTASPPGPLWLEGGEASLPGWSGKPIAWLLDLARPVDRECVEAVTPHPGEAQLFAGRHDAGERLLRRRAARHLLRAASGCPVAEVAIAAGPLGAPVVKAPVGWWMSAAARWPRLIVAVARQPIGVDIEVAAEPLPDDLLTLRERRHMTALRADERPLASASAWASKEAHAKWTGRPRTVDPAGVETAGVETMEADMVRSTHGNSRCWRLVSGNAVVALCLASGEAGQ